MNKITSFFKEKSAKLNSFYKKLRYKEVKVSVSSGEKVIIKKRSVLPIVF